MAARATGAEDPNDWYLLEAAQRAMNAGAFDAARANASLAVVSALRAAAGREPVVGVGRPPEPENAVDELQASGRLAPGLARDVRSMLESYRVEFFAPTGYDEAQKAVTVARLTAAVLDRGHTLRPRK